MFIEMTIRSNIISTIIDLPFLVGNVGHIHLPIIANYCQPEEVPNSSSNSRKVILDKERLYSLQ